MGLDLGTLSITIGVDDSGVTQKLDGTKKKLDQVKTSADQVDKIKAAPTVDEKGIDKASNSTKKLGSDLDQVGSKRVKPSVDSSEVVKASDAVRSLADGLGGAAEKVVKWSAGAAAVAGIGTIGTAFTKGFQRLDALDQAEAKLEALGNSGRDIQIVMDNALASVKGTSFGIGDAASTAAVLVGAGVKPGEELDRTLKLVADSAAIAGVSFGEMGSIWGKVASSTVLSGEEMAQISDRSIGLQVALAEQLGVTALEAKKMVSEGKVSFADFETAMESLVGGGAVRMGNTVSGAMDNFGAALGRGGAAILESGFEQLPNVLGAATSTVDDLTASITPLASEFGAKLAPHLENFASNLGPNVAAGMSMIADGAGVLAPLISNLGTGLSSIPFPLVAGGLTALVAQNKGWIDSLNSGSGKIKQYSSQLQDGLVGALSRAGSAYDAGSAKLNVIAQNHRTAAAAAKAQSLQTTDAFTSMDRMGASTARSLVASTTQIGAGFSGMARGGLSLAKSSFDGVKSAAGGLMGAMGGPWGLAITGATAAIGYLAAEHFKAKQAEEEHKAAQLELAGTLDATTGAVTRQTEEMVKGRLAESGVLDTARELKLSAEIITQASLGNEAAMERVKLATDQSNLSFIESSEWWGKYGQAVRDAGFTAGDVLDSLERRQSGGPVTQLDRDISALMGTMQGGSGAMHRFSGEFEKSQEDIIALGNSVTEANNDLNELTTEEAQDRLVNFQDQVKRTQEVIEALGDATIKLESNKSISVEADAVTMETKQLLEDIDGITTSEMEGRLSIQFDDAFALSDMLESIGVKLTKLDGGYIGLDTTDLSEAQAMADALGAGVQEIDGKLALDYLDLPEATALLDALGILVKDPDNLSGELIVDWSAIDTSEKRLDDLRANVEKGMKGDLTIRDNAQEVSSRVSATLDGKTTRGTHEIWEKYYGSGRATSTSGTAVGQHYNADGNVLEFYANGGTRENHVAQIAPAGAWRVWAEDETGGEAYIPLHPSKRGRSENILAEVARRFGKTIIDQDAVAFADGGLSDRVISALSPYNNGRYVMGGFSPEATDCSAAVSMGVNAYLGLDPFDSRMSTVTEREWLAAKGFQEGRGGDGDLVVGWYDYGGGALGHTAMQLPDGTYIESGGNTGQGLTIGGKAGPLDGRGFTDFMYLPGTGGEDPDANYSTSGGSGYRTSYGSSGGSGGSGGSGITKTVNGGRGALVEDGSFLELAAAIYSHQTGTPMADDIVSWGNVMGLGTTYEGEDLPRQQRDIEREQRALKRDHAATLRDIEQAKADLKKQEDELKAGGKETGSGKNKKFTAWTEEEKAERERKILDQRDKILDLEDRLIDLADSEKDLIESQEKLRTAIERAAEQPTSFGASITPMANGGILGSLNRNAQIADGSSSVLWAEDGPEAYIPLSTDKKARSTDIWLETGKRLGFDVMSMLSLLGAGASGLARGDLGGFGTGNSFSFADAGLNLDAVAYRGKQEVVNAVGANFYGPVQINDPRQYLESQLDTAQKQIHAAMKGLRNGR